MGFLCPVVAAAAAAAVVVVVVVEAELLYDSTREHGLLQVGLSSLSMCLIALVICLV